MDLYNLVIHPTNDDEDDPRDEDESRRKTAEGFFAALFADRPELMKHGFYDNDTALAFLGNAKGATDKQMLAKIEKWVVELLNKCGVQDGVARLEASAANELTTKLEPFIAVVDADDSHLQSPSLWPLISHIKYVHSFTVECT